MEFIFAEKIYFILRFTVSHSPRKIFHRGYIVSWFLEETLFAPENCAILIKPLVTYVQFYEVENWTNYRWVVMPRNGSGSGNFEILLIFFIILDEVDEVLFFWVYCIRVVNLCNWVFVFLDMHFGLCFLKPMYVCLIFVSIWSWFRSLFSWDVTGFIFYCMAQGFFLSIEHTRFLVNVFWSSYFQLIVWFRYSHWCNNYVTHRVDNYFPISDIQVNARGRLSWLDKVELLFGPNNMRMMRCSCFGHLFDVPELHNQGQLYNILGV